MKYRLALTDLRSFLPGSKTIIFLIVFLAGPGLSSYTAAQTAYWAVTADLGASVNRTKEDTLTRQGLLLPAYGVSVVFGKVVSHGVTLKATLGYRNRGGVAKVSSDTDPDKNLTLGSYRVHSRDHFLSNDLAVQLNAKYWKVFGLVPFASLGIRNDVYLVTNSRTTSKDEYFKPDNSRLHWSRSNHHRNYVVGLAGAAGVQLDEVWNLALEYYHQVSGSFLIPSAVRANYSQLYSRSLQFNVTYRF